MATRRTVELACDLPGRHADYVETHSFTLNGQDYEFDACTKHAQSFASVVGKFTDYARVVKLDSSRPEPRIRRTAERRHSRDIRAWAKESGMDVGDVGRIPTKAVREYEKTH